MSRTCRPILLSLLLAPSAGAHDLLVCEITSETVLRLSGQDGALLDAVFLDLKLGTGKAPEAPIELLVVDDELWVIDLSADVIHVWSTDGQTYIGQHGTGRDAPAGGAVANGSVWINNRDNGGAGYGDAIKEYAPDGTLLNVHKTNDTWDILFDGGAFLSSNTLTHNIERYGLDGSFLGVFFDGPSAGILFPEQITRRKSNGNFLIAGFQSEKIHEIDPSGNHVKNFKPQIGGLRAAWELGDGNILLTSTTGIYVWDVVAKTANPVVTGISAASITEFKDGGPIGSSYCGPANLNSLGLSAEVSAFGDDAVASNFLELTADRMPPNQFGYFLNSMTPGFIPFPGNSQGNLCLSGGIGRHNQQIGNTGAAGTFTITVDLTNVPIPPGFTQIAAGETWYWTCWYRDVNPTPTSNFTDGVGITFQ